MLNNFFQKRTIATQPVPPFNGTYEISSEVLAASYSYAF